MSKISIKTSHDDRTNTDWYRSFSLLDYDDDLPEGITTEIKPDPDDHNPIWSEYPWLVLWEIIEPGGGVRYIARPERRYRLCADTVQICDVNELYDNLADAKAAYEKYAASKKGKCVLYDQKKHAIIAQFDPNDK